jgi:zinc/manganese transport system substrate-binding protein
MPRTVADARSARRQRPRLRGLDARLIKSSGSKATVIVASPRKADHATDDHGHGHGGDDPHAWQSVANAKIYVGNIATALIAVADPARPRAIEANADAYLAKLECSSAKCKAAVGASRRTGAR